MFPDRVCWQNNRADQGTIAETNWAGVKAGASLPKGRPHDLHAVLCHKILVRLRIDTCRSANIFSNPPGVTPNSNTPGSVPMFWNVWGVLGGMKIKDPAGALTTRSPILKLN